MIENIKTYRILVSGRVQGVGFRYFAESVAEKYGIRGYVRNTADGRVEIECQGDDEEIRPFMDDIRKGPAFSMVTDVRVEDFKSSRKYNFFEVKY